MLPSLDSMALFFAVRRSASIRDPKGAIGKCIVSVEDTNQSAFGRSRLVKVYFGESPTGPHEGDGELAAVYWRARR